MQKFLKIIDVHTHILNEEFYNDYNRNFEKILCINFFEGFANGEVVLDNKKFEEVVAGHENLYAVEPIDYTRDVTARLRELDGMMDKPNKIKAVKLYTGYQHFYPDDEKILPVYSFCARHGIPAVFHSGVTYTYRDSRAMLDYSRPLHIDKAAVLFPDVKFVISHLGFPYLLEAATVACKNENVYTDVSGTLESMVCYPAYLDDLKRLLLYYPGLSDKLMFGTDYLGPDSTLTEVDGYLKLVGDAFPDEAAREKVFYTTAKKVYTL
jgi:Predicted metal-dependent hydrolase of the TIM-barrel fold